MCMDVLLSGCFSVVAPFLGMLVVFLHATVLVLYLVNFVQINGTKMINFSHCL